MLKEYLQTTKIMKPLECKVITWRWARNRVCGRCVFHLGIILCIFHFPGLLSMQLVISFNFQIVIMLFNVSSTCVIGVFTDVSDWGVNC